MKRAVGLASGIALAVATSIGWPAPASSQSVEILIYGGLDHKDFLGCLNCSSYDSRSIANEYSDYGWDNSFGKWNRFGEYASPYASTSACADYASDPPVLVDVGGNFYGRLSVNPYAQGSICGASGNDQVCQALHAMCSKD